MRAVDLGAAMLVFIAPAQANEGSVDEEIAEIRALAEAARSAPVGRDLKSLYEADLDFAADASARHVADAFADRFLADGMMLPDGRPPVVGPDAVRAALKDSKAEWHWAPVEGKADKTLGVTWGRAFLVVRGADGEAAATFRSRYVTVWAREKKGPWRIWIDLGTEASPEE
jgi:ketosteroid isomerase-like protein